MIKLFWNRLPGKFVNLFSGKELKLLEGMTGPTFSGTVHEWYETLVETMIIAHNRGLDAGVIQRDAMVDCKCAPDVACILEATVLFKPNYANRKVLCENCAKLLAVEPIGTLTNRFAITIDREMPSNVIKVGDFAEIEVLDVNL